MGGLRAAEREVMAKRARVAALEEELGGGTDISGSGSEDGSEEGEEGEEAAKSGGDGTGA